MLKIVFGVAIACVCLCILILYYGHENARLAISEKVKKYPYKESEFVLSDERFGFINWHKPTYSYRVRWINKGTTARYYWVYFSNNSIEIGD